MNNFFLLYKTEIRKILSGENIKSLMNIEKASEGNKYGYECK